MYVCVCVCIYIYIYIYICPWCCSSMSAPIHGCKRTCRMVTCGLGFVEHMGMHVRILLPYHNSKRRGFAVSRFGSVDVSSAD